MCMECVLDVWYGLTSVFCLGCTGAIAGPHGQLTGCVICDRDLTRQSHATWL